jgi:hypothetical protein
MIEAVVLYVVEPDQAQRPVLPDPAEQVADLRELPRPGATEVFGSRIGLPGLKSLCLV